MTYNELIESSLRLCGVLEAGETASFEDASDALDTLNDMLEEWNIERLMVLAYENEDLSLTSGTQEYTIGSGGTLNTTRPIKIEGAWFRDASNFDYNMAIVDNDQFFSIVDKSVTSNIPELLTYNPTYPLGKIRIWPIPNVNGTLRLASWKQLSSVALTDTVSLAPGYRKALKWCLAVELYPEYQRGVDPVVAQRAADMKRKLKSINGQDYVMKTDPNIVTKSSRYNINSDSY